VAKIAENRDHNTDSFQVVVHLRLCFRFHLGRGREPRRRRQDQAAAAHQGRVRAVVQWHRRCLCQDLQAGNGST
jgi:hypothetical protein